MIVPSTRQFTAGEIETGTYLNNSVTNLGNFMLGKPIVQAYSTATQTLTTGTLNGITLNTESIDRDNTHSTTTNTAVFTIQTAGWYYVNGSVTFASNATGYRYALISVNSSYFYKQVVPAVNGAVTTVSTVPMLHYLNVGDTVSLLAFQNSGGNLNTSNSEGEQSRLSLIWVSL